MNVFKKISLKYFNGSSNLNEGEERDIITSRDKAFIYACRKYNLEFEYYREERALFLCCYRSYRERFERKSAKYFHIR